MSGLVQIDREDDNGGESGNLERLRALSELPPEALDYLGKLAVMRELAAGAAGVAAIMYLIPLFVLAGGPWIGWGWAFYGAVSMLLFVQVLGIVV